MHLENKELSSRQGGNKQEVSKFIVFDSYLNWLIISVICELSPTFDHVLLLSTNIEVILHNNSAGQRQTQEWNNLSTRESLSLHIKR